MPAIQLLQWKQKQTEEEIRQLKEEIDVCAEIRPKHRQAILEFLLAEGICHMSEIDYTVREKYEQYVQAEYVRASWRPLMVEFDRIKQQSMRKQMQTLAGMRKMQLKYENKVLYLPYHPDQELAMMFDGTVDKHTLVWDFSRNAPEKMKRQVFDVLHYIIRTFPDRTKRRIPYAGLRRFYDFCVETEVQDIEEMELEETECFRKTLQTEKEIQDYVPIVKFCKKVIFMQAEEIHWNAGIWFMERIHIEAWRMNPSTPVRSISFLEVKHLQNRRFLQSYMKYGIGLTSIVMRSLQSEFSYVRGFLIWYEQQTSEDVCKASEEQMELYFKYLSGGTYQDDTYNKAIMCILHFFIFLKVRGHIDKVPFCEEYYLKKTVQKHNDRTVETEAYLEILRNLYKFPEKPRLMFLHLFGIGLRINEVCTLQGNAYYIQNNDAWIQVYQYKMRNYKRIPIPWAIYKLMKVYMEKYDIGPEDYVFQNMRGGAYSYSTFRKQMLDCCKENNIRNGEYLFKSHDYRHTVATNFYDNEVSLQGVRDYLGHSYEEMTQRYIDYMPKRIAKANEEYFSQPENSLAGKLKKRCQDGKQNLPK